MLYNFFFEVKSRRAPWCGVVWRWVSVTLAITVAGNTKIQSWEGTIALNLMTENINCVEEVNSVSGSVC